MRLLAVILMIFSVPNTIAGRGVSMEFTHYHEGREITLQLIQTFLPNGKSEFRLQPKTGIWPRDHESKYNTLNFTIRYYGSNNKMIQVNCTMPFTQKTGHNLKTTLILNGTLLDDNKNPHQEETKKHCIAFRWGRTENPKFSSAEIELPHIPKFNELSFCYQPNNIVMVTFPKIEQNTPYYFTLEPMDQYNQPADLFERKNPKEDSVKFSIVPYNRWLVKMVSTNNKYDYVGQVSATNIIQFNNTGNQSINTCDFLHTHQSYCADTIVATESMIQDNYNGEHLMKYQILSNNDIENQDVYNPRKNLILLEGQVFKLFINNSLYYQTQKPPILNNFYNGLLDSLYSFIEITGGFNETLPLQKFVSRTNNTVYHQLPLNYSAQKSLNITISKLYKFNPQFNYFIEINDKIKNVNSYTKTNFAVKKLESITLICKSKCDDQMVLKNIITVVNSQQISPVIAPQSNNSNTTENVVLLMPNVFTPNGDGINDFFIIKNAEQFDRIDLRIFNRWGDRVFYSEDPKFQWNGRVNNDGPEVPTDIYFYQLSYRQRGQEADYIMNGSVNVVRDNTPMATNTSYPKDKKRSNSEMGKTSLLAIQSIAFAVHDYLKLENWDKNITSLTKQQSVLTDIGIHSSSLFNPFDSNIETYTFGPSIRLKLMPYEYGNFNVFTTGTVKPLFNQYSENQSYLGMQNEWTIGIALGSKRNSSGLRGLGISTEYSQITTKVATYNWRSQVLSTQLTYRYLEDYYHRNYQLGYFHIFHSPTQYQNLASLIRELPGQFGYFLSVQSKLGPSWKIQVYPNQFNNHYSFQFELNFSFGYSNTNHQ